MDFLVQALAWILDPEHLLMDGGIWPRTLDHLLYTGLAMLIALLVGLPLGFAIGHTGRGRGLVVGITGAARALPTLGFLLYIVLFTGLGLWPLVAVLAVLAVPPVLAGAYSGIEAVDRVSIDAARSIGLTEWQVLWRVEVPQASALVLGGIRSAVLQVIATATIAGYVGLTGLGRFLIEGLATRDYVVAVVGAILVTALALLVDGVLALLQRAVAGAGSAAPGRPPGHRMLGMSARSS